MQRRALSTLGAGSEMCLMDCLDCARLNREYDRLCRAHLAALLKTLAHNKDGERQQYLLLDAMVNEAQIEMDLAQAELVRHRDTHSVPN
jgi:hypothetical protein